MVSTAALQAHYEEIAAQMPVLPLAAAPKGFANLDIASLADTPAEAKKVTHILGKGSSTLHQCQICSNSGSGQQLGLLVSTSLDFASRTVTATAGRFACSVCRAVSSPALLLELSTSSVASEDYGRSERLQELFLHFAAVNSAPASITGNPDALAVWVQELACRAYSMQVLASSLKSWKLAGPNGQLQLGPGAAVQLLQQLLPAEFAGDAAAPVKASGKTAVAKQAAAVQDVAGRKKKNVAAASGKQQHHKQQQQQQQQRQVDNGAPKPSKRKSSAGEAAFAGSSIKKAKKQAAAEAAVVSSRVAGNDAQQTPKQHKQQATDKPQTAGKEQTPKQQHQQTPKQPEGNIKKKQKHVESWQNSLAGRKQKVSASALTDAAKTASGGSNKSGKAAATTAKQQAAHVFKTPQATKIKKAGKTAKRRLSDPS